MKICKRFVIYIIRCNACVLQILQKRVNCRFLLLVVIVFFACVHMKKSICFYGIFVQIVAFAIHAYTHRECVLFSLRGETFRALHSSEQTYRAQHIRKKRANNNAKLQYKENHVLQIVLQFVCECLCACAKFLFPWTKM